MGILNVPVDGEHPGQSRIRGVEEILSVGMDGTGMGLGLEEAAGRVKFLGIGIEVGDVLKGVEPFTLDVLVIG